MNPFEAKYLYASGICLKHVLFRMIWLSWLCRPWKGNQLEAPYRALSNEEVCMFVI